MLTGLTAWAEENVPVLQFYMYDGSVVRMELPGKTTMKVKKKACSRWAPQRLISKT